MSQSFLSHGPYFTESSHSTSPNKIVTKSMCAEIMMIWIYYKYSQCEMWACFETLNNGNRWLHRFYNVSYAIYSDKMVHLTFSILFQVAADNKIIWIQIHFLSKHSSTVVVVVYWNKLPISTFTFLIFVPASFMLCDRTPSHDWFWQFI